MSKLYLPGNYINSNYKYYTATSNSKQINIRTNNHCVANNSQLNCDCYTLYTDLGYFITDAYTCNYNGSITTANLLNYTNFTSDIWYRNDIVYILIIFLILFIFIIKYPLKIFMRLFGRWLKL